MMRLPYFILFTSIIFVSCKKESFITSPDANISLSADSLKFDTVFTSTGSVTQSFKITNTNSKKLLISEIKLMGGVSSSYKMNVNGMPANTATHVELAAYDSLYVFVAVNINPGSANLPFIVSDSIRISYNGNQQWVQLEAYGQNAHFLNHEVITGSQTWSNDLPYVILGSLQIDTGASLQINAGCKIYAHANAPILVDGTMTVTGTKNNEVVFSGDRLDPDYKDLPAAWPGIIFRNTSLDNVLTFATIKNSYQALVVEGPATTPNSKLTLHQCVIDNAFDAGIFASSTSILAENTLVSNCRNNIVLIGGGDYQFTNCTDVCFSNQYALHEKPVLQISNYDYINGTLISNDLTANFTNCIFWGDFGSVEDEIISSKQGNNLFDVNINNCLFKLVNTPPNTSINASINNLDPLFDSIDVNHYFYDFRITANNASPALDNGAATPFTKDLDDNPRISGMATDIGCYEKQ